MSISFLRLSSIIIFFVNPNVSNLEDFKVLVQLGLGGPGVGWWSVERGNVERLSLPFRITPTFDNKFTS